MTKELNKTMNDKKPIKRSKELISLSSEHHDALMTCWKIKTALTNGTSIDRITEYIAQYYEKELKPHFEKEEQFLFTLLPEDNAGRVKALNQHDGIVDLVNTLRNGEDALRGIMDFNRLLEEHIRFEERELFPLIEQSADPELFAKAGEELEERKNKIPLLWDEFFGSKN